MSTTVYVIVAVLAFVVVAALAAAAVLASRNLQHRRLHDRFGTEYEWTVQAKGDRKEAELDLRGRARRRKGLKLRELNPEERAHYQQEWRTVQANLVDAPIKALGQADALMTNMMLVAGYPMQDFDDQADLVSVDHPAVVENYRKGRRNWCYGAPQVGGGSSATAIFSLSAVLREAEVGTGDRDAASRSRRLTSEDIHRYERIVQVGAVPNDADFEWAASWEDGGGKAEGDRLLLPPEIFGGQVRPDRWRPAGPFRR